MNSHKNIHFSGPGYISKSVHSMANGTKKIVTSRRNRKGRGSIIVTHDGTIVPTTGFKNPWLHLYKPSSLTWWVAVLFTIGSALFSVGGYAITFPQNTPEVLMTGMTVDWIFFIGSLFFTSAAFCQVLEAIKAGDTDGLYADEKPPSQFWQPKRIGYMASLVQLIGTVMFNFNTGNAFISDLNWIQQDVLIWSPNIIGCICFLIASRLAYMEVCHAYWGWQPRNIEWWITSLNLLGSIGFMISALYSLPVAPGDSSVTFSWMSALFTFQGAVCFLIASYLLLPEMFSE